MLDINLIINDTKHVHDALLKKESTYYYNKYLH